MQLLRPQHGHCISRHIVLPIHLHSVIDTCMYIFRPVRVYMYIYICICMCINMYMYVHKYI